MFKSDAEHERYRNLLNVDNLSIDIIPHIERDIEPCDIISLVFLLYDTPDTALQRLSVYQRISKDESEMNLLSDWAAHAKTRNTWKKQFIEALYVCQLYSIIRKMGLIVSEVKQYFMTTNESLLSPMKVALYRLCENIKVDNLYKLKKTLSTFDIDTTDYETCEMVLLELMCRKFITLPDGTSTIIGPGIENFATIVESLSDLQGFAKSLRELELRPDKSKTKTSLETSNPSNRTETTPTQEEKDKMYIAAFEESFKHFNFSEKEILKPHKMLKSDIVLNNNVYEIKNPKNVGVCLIINQEKFYPSKDSIYDKTKRKPLEDRLGSTKDKEKLTETMKELNFEVIAYDNLSHKDMIEKIKDVLKYRVYEEHSMFMLCVLSHGTRGHIFAANSVKVDVDDIEALLDSDDLVNLRNKPKLMILQACQVKDVEVPSFPNLVADGPKSVRYHIKKSDTIKFWATAPNYAAYRNEKMGSIFIQLLCDEIKNHSDNSVHDVFTTVIYNVKKICVQLKCEQLPRVEHTLDKKLFFRIPNA